MENYFKYRKNTVQRHCEGDSPKQSKAPLIPLEGRRQTTPLFTSPNPSEGGEQTTRRGIRTTLSCVSPLPLFRRGLGGGATHSAGRCPTLLRMPFQGVGLFLDCFAPLAMTVVRKSYRINIIKQITVQTK